MQALDHRIVAWMSGLRLPIVTPLMRLASTLGSRGLMFLAIAAALSAVRRRPGPLATTLAAVLCSSAASTALKHVVGRARPSVAYHDVHPLVPTPDSPAMPSGHAWTAFAAATVLAAAAPRLRIPL